MKIDWTLIIVIICVVAFLFFFDGIKVIQELLSGLMKK